jgi:hypothetical protein
MIVLRNFAQWEFGNNLYLIKIILKGSDFLILFYVENSFKNQIQYTNYKYFKNKRYDKVKNINT